MNIPPFCILQMRLNSTRLPRKMLLTLGSETLAARAWRIACEAFGKENCVVGIPMRDENTGLADELIRVGALVYSVAGDERDVLQRFHLVAHQFRSDPASVIVRYTGDDWRKDVDSLRRVAAGERLPVEMGGEAFTLAALDKAHKKIRRFTTRGKARTMREHLTYALFDTLPPSPPDDGLPWSIDSQSDYDAACAAYAAGRR